MTAVVEILVAELNGVLTVPVEAVVEQGRSHLLLGPRRAAVTSAAPWCWE